MKYLIIITLCMLLNSCLNPLDFGNTKLVHLESDQKNISFECNDKIVADWSEWFKWSKEAGVFKVDKIGLKIYKSGDKVRIRYTLFPTEEFDSYYQKEASYKSDNYNRIVDYLGLDSTVLTNLEVRY